MISILGLRINLDWFHNHADHAIIAKWTRGKEGETPRHELSLEIETPKTDSEWCFLALGDTGDSDRFGPRTSPQRAVAMIMAQDCELPEIPVTPETPQISGATALQPKAQMVLHTGDINYLTGEERLYDLNFIDPYRAFQTPESHFHDLTFRIPFLPVPGNHDYYDLHGWMGHIMKLGSWTGFSKPLTHFFHRLGLPVPFGGSEMGAAYMKAFVDSKPDIPQPLPYRPGESTKLPNRYYQFRAGNVHCFALDSNTLDSPPPGVEDPWKEKAAVIVEHSEKNLDRLNAQVEADRNWEHEEVKRQREAMKSGEREELWTRLQPLLEDVNNHAEALARSTTHWASKITKTLPDGAAQLKDLAQKTSDLHDTWHKIILAITDAPQKIVSYETRLDELIDLQEAWMQHLVERDKLTVSLPAAPEYEAVRQARLEFESSLGSWCRERAGADLPGPCSRPTGEEEDGEGCEVPTPETDLEQVDLSEAILDTQRDLALARKVSERTDEDYDAAQIAWLRAGLAAVKAEELELQKSDPKARLWRIVYLHHPLYTTTPSHAERGDSIGVRRNLELLLQDADVVISGHSHGFEWLHSNAAPHQCYLVTGAGGQSRLQGSVFSPQLAAMSQPIIESITQAGLDTLVWASGNPTSSGATVEDKIFSYLRFRVSPEHIQIEPVGVRQVSSETGENNWERVWPMPVHEVADTASWKDGGAGATTERLIKHIIVKRDETPVAVWAD